MLPRDLVDGFRANQDRVRILADLTAVSGDKACYQVNNGWAETPPFQVPVLPLDQRGIWVAIASDAFLLGADPRNIQRESLEIRETVDDLPLPRCIRNESTFWTRRSGSASTNRTL